MRRLLGLVLPGLLLFSCGGGSGSSAQSTCQQIGTITCQKACDCQDGAGCAVTQDGFTETFNSQSDCLGILVTFSCSQGDTAAYNDAAACLPLIQAATCTGSGTDGALAYPGDNACQTPPSP
jgi:hypothetical protein